MKYHIQQAVVNHSFASKRPCKAIPSHRCQSPKHAERKARNRKQILTTAVQPQSVDAKQGNIRLEDRRGGDQAASSSSSVLPKTASLWKVSIVRQGEWSYRTYSSEEACLIEESSSTSFISSSSSTFLPFLALEVDLAAALPLGVGLDLVTFDLLGVFYTYIYQHGIRPHRAMEHRSP